jgi:ribosomal protein L30/L7E
MDHQVTVLKRGPRNQPQLISDALSSLRLPKSDEQKILQNNAVELFRL